VGPVPVRAADPPLGELAGLAGIRAAHGAARADAAPASHRRDDPVPHGGHARSPVGLEDPPQVLVAQDEVRATRGRPSVGPGRDVAVRPTYSYFLDRHPELAPTAR